MRVQRLYSQRVIHWVKQINDYCCVEVAVSFPDNLQVVVALAMLLRPHRFVQAEGGPNFLYLCSSVGMTKAYLIKSHHNEEASSLWGSASFRLGLTN